MSEISSATSAGSSVGNSAENSTENSAGNRAGNHPETGERIPIATDWAGIVDDLNRLLRLRTTPVAMKRFRTREDMEAIPRIRRPSAIHTTDQIVGQAARNGWTVGITAEDLVGAQCGVVVGLHPRDDAWLSGQRMTGVWYATAEDAAAHQAAMDHASHGTHEALAVAPLASGRLAPPDICLIYATPAQMILFINGLQWTGYRKLEWGCVGESSCADSWGRAHGATLANSPTALRATAGAGARRVAQGRLVAFASGATQPMRPQTRALRGRQGASASALRPLDVAPLRLRKRALMRTHPGGQSGGELASVAPRTSRACRFPASPSAATAASWRTSC